DRRIADSRIAILCLADFVPRVLEHLQQFRRGLASNERGKFRVEQNEHHPHAVTKRFGFPGIATIATEAFETFLVVIVPCFCRRLAYRLKLTRHLDLLFVMSNASVKTESR